MKIHIKHIFGKTGIRGRYGLTLSGLKEKCMLRAAVEAPSQLPSREFLAMDVV